MQGCIAHPETIEMDDTVYLMMTVTAPTPKDAGEIALRSLHSRCQHDTKVVDTALVWIPEDMNNAAQDQ